MVWPALIAAGASLAGGLLASKSQSDANKANAQNSQLDRDQQRDFAQQGIKWRVDDARQSGIHPLYAMGASLPTYSPTAIGAIPETGLSQGITGAGQDISRAVRATATQGQRTAEMRQLTIRNAQLNNDLLSAQINNINRRTGIGPPMPSATGSPGLDPGLGSIQDNPMERIGANPTSTGSEPGAVTSHGWSWTGKVFQPTPSLDTKERIEDQILPEAAWAWSHYGPGRPKPPSNLKPSGSTWKWSTKFGGWFPAYPGRSRPNMRRPGGRKIRQGYKGNRR